MAKLQNKLEKEDSGLAQLAGRLAASPRSQRLALVLCDAAKVERDLHTGGEVITVRMTEMEEVPAGYVADAVDMLQRARADRLAPVIRRAEDVRRLFPEGTRIDPNTGEILSPQEPTQFLWDEEDPDADIEPSSEGAAVVDLADRLVDAMANHVVEGLAEQEEGS